MNYKVWISVLAAAVLYIAFVMLVGFPNLFGLSINFARVTISVAVLILFVPWIGIIFSEVPAPRRDYLLAGIILTWLSAFCFSVWNEAGRIFGVQTSIFISPIAGFFSLLLVTGGVFHFIAPDTASKTVRIIAVVIGLMAGAALVFVAPLFR